MPKRRRKIRPRGSKAFQHFHANVDLRHKCLVLALAQDLVEEGVACPALRFQDAELALAGVHQQSHGQGQIRFPREVADRLRDAVFFQQEFLAA